MNLITTYQTHLKVGAYLLVSFYSLAIFFNKDVELTHGEGIESLIIVQTLHSSLIFKIMF